MKRSLFALVAYSLLLLLFSPQAVAQNSSRIVGGVDALPGEFPSIAYLQIEINGSFYQCAGSFIDEVWILTAAHCVTNDNGTPIDLREANTSIVALSGVEDLGAFSTPESGAEIWDATSLYTHPNFDVITFDYDVALIQVRNRNGVANNPPTFLTLSNPTLDAQFAAATTETIAIGWGRTSESGPTTDILQKVGVPIVSNSECNQSYGGITDRMICAGFEEGGKDACAGDSGGPLIAYNEYGNPIVVGITSFGYGCARAGFPGVYARVSTLLDWISSTSNIYSTSGAIPRVTFFGSTGFASLSSGIAVDVAYEIQPALLEGAQAELYLFVLAPLPAPFNVLAWDFERKEWTFAFLGATLNPSAFASEDSLEPMRGDLLTQAVLPRGRWIFYLGVDRNINNSIDVESLSLTYNILNIF